MSALKTYLKILLQKVFGSSFMHLFKFTDFKDRFRKEHQRQISYPVELSNKTEKQRGISNNYREFRVLILRSLEN
jgi:transposase